MRACVCTQALFMFFCLFCFACVVCVHLCLFQNSVNLKDVLTNPVCVFNSLSDVSLDIAENRVTGQDRAFPVEQCNCPPQYRGLSCEVGHFVVLLQLSPLVPRPFLWSLCGGAATALLSNTASPVR